MATAKIGSPPQRHRSPQAAVVIHGEDSVGRRLVVVGTSGSGKTTLARQVAHCMKYPHIELDSLYWGPNWCESPHFIEQVVELTQRPFWVLDGNYSKVQSIVWPRADTIIWLDYSIWVCYWRMVRRTFRRVFLRQRLWNGNRETFRAQFLTKESLFVWIYQTHGRRRQRYQQLMQANNHPHLTWLHHQTPSSTKRWLGGICPG